MALSTKVGSFNVTTQAAGNTVVVSGVGFAPKALIFWWSGRTESVNAVSATINGMIGVGFATSATDRQAIGCAFEDGAAAANTAKISRGVQCITTSLVGSGVDGLMDLQTLDSDGFTLVIDDAFGVDVRCFYLALGGDSLTNAVTGQITAPATTGNQNITSLAFQPDCVLFAAIGSTVAAETAVDGSFMLGAAAGATPANKVIHGFSDDAADPMVTDAYCISGECIATSAAPNVVQSRASVTAWLSNGFTLNWAENSTADIIFFLALKGGNYLVGDFTTSLVLDADIVESGFGFKPSGALFASHFKSQSTSDTTQSNNTATIGAFSSITDRGAVTNFDENAAMTENVASAIRFDAIYANISTAGAINGLVDIQSIDADGFTLNQDDPDSSSTFVWYLAFGPAAAPPAENLVDLIKSGSVISFAR